MNTFKIKIEHPIYKDFSAVNAWRQEQLSPEKTGILVDTCFLNTSDAGIEATFNTRRSWVLFIPFIEWMKSMECKTFISVCTDGNRKHIGSNWEYRDDTTVEFWQAVARAQMWCGYSE